MVKDYSKAKWFVDIDKVRVDYPRVENLAQFIAKDPPELHPEHPLYLEYWSKEIKKCIEGVWGQMFDKWRWMPGNLYYFGNFGVIEHSWKEGGVTVTEDIKPLIVDYIWEYAYQSMACYGFSGFAKDENISCNSLLRQYYAGEVKQDILPETCYRPDGTLKQYEDPFDYLSRLQDKKLGKALMENATEDYMNMGSRGSTKSYWSAIGELEYNFVFGGARRYDQKFIDNEYKCSQCVGASETDKSSEMLNKMEYSLDAKTNAESKKFKRWFGIWTELDSDGKVVITPPPIYKRHLGDLSPGNKKSLFRSNYKVEINGEWKEVGNDSTVAHVNYSTKKGLGGDRAAEGGRYLISIIEEVGSMPNFIGVKGANDGTVTRGGERIGIQAAQGTSGNIEFVQAAKKVFENPKNYSIRSYVNKFSEKPTAYFIPYYMTLLKFKDKDGNTKYQEAIDEVNRQRAIEESDDPKTLRDFVMNKPCYIHEMWSTGKESYLPYDELAEREKQLVNIGSEIETCVRLRWDSTKPNGVDYEIDHEAEPYRAFPHDAEKMKNPEGCVVIYDFPKEFNGSIPPDLYCYVGHDPHGDGKEPGSSVASTYILMNPRYAGTPYNLKGNTIVASWNGKPKGGLDEYYEIQEKLISFYGNPPAAIMYERNKGEACRGHYIKKHKIHLLAPTPQFGQGSSATYKQQSTFGYYTGASGDFGKSNMIKHVNDWLLEITELEDGAKKNVERLPCIYLVRQMMQYDLKGNFDAVDGFRGCILSLTESKIRQQSENKKKTEKTTTYQSLLNNHRIFQQRRNGRQDQ